MKSGYGVNYYCTLGVSRDASMDQISAAYRELTISLQSGEMRGISRNQLINAFHTLSNPVKRKEYDRTLPPEVPAFTITDLEFDESFTSAEYSGSSLRSKVEKIVVKNRSNDRRSFTVQFDPTPFAGVYGRLQSEQQAGRRKLPESATNKLMGRYTYLKGMRLFSKKLYKESRFIDTALLTLGISAPVATLTLVGLYLWLG